MPNAILNPGGIESEEVAASPTPIWRRPRSLLILVAVVHAAAPLALLGIHWWFGVDETVYLSQLNAHVPAGLFSAPRARGSTLIAAPVTLLTSSTAAVRIWVAGLSGVGLYVAFRPWLHLRRGYVVPLAALLLSTLWMVTFYAFTVMPNEWVGFGVLAACGYALRYLRDGARWQLGVVALAMALVALLRPSDAAYGGIALAACCAFVGSASRRRRTLAAGAVVLGAVAGAAEWVVEAYTSYGGLSARIHAAQAEQGGGGLHFSGLLQARALAGPLLCRGTCAASAGAAYRLWWLGLAVLVVVALAAGARRRALTLELVPVVVGLGMAVQYLFTVGYAAPRFLIPTYALLAVPCASAGLTILSAPRPRGARAAVAAVLGVALVLHSAVQVRVITTHVAPTSRVVNKLILAQAHRLHRIGVRAPCLVLGQSGNNENIAYAMGCANVPRRAAAVRAEIAHGTRAVWLSGRRPPRRYGAGWYPVLVRGLPPHRRHPYYVSFVPTPTSTASAPASPARRPAQRVGSSTPASSTPALSTRAG